MGSALLSGPSADDRPIERTLRDMIRGGTVGVLAAILLIALTQLTGHIATVVQSFFACPITARVGPFRVRSDRPVTATERQALLDGVRQARAAGVQIDPGQRVYLAHTTAALKTMSTDTSRHYMGSHHVVFGWVVLNRRDWPLDPQILTHELTHAYVSHHVGRWAALQMPWWKSDGLANYAEWQGREARELLPSTRIHNYDTTGKTDEYFYARTMVSTAMGGRPSDPLSDASIDAVMDEDRGEVRLMIAAALEHRLSNADWHHFRDAWDPPRP